MVYYGLVFRVNLSALVAIEHEEDDDARRGEFEVALHQIKLHAECGGSTSAQKNVKMRPDSLVSSLPEPSRACWCKIRSFRLRAGVQNQIIWTPCWEIILKIGSYFF